MARRRWFRVATWLAGCWLVAACSGEDSAAEVSPVPEDQLVSRLVAAVCDNIGSCCESSGFAFDHDQCWAYAESEFSFFFYYPSYPHIEYDAAAAGKCVKAVEAASSSCGAFTFETDPSCIKVMAGTLQDGEACEASAECARPSGGYSTCETGVCSTAMFVHEGGSCGIDAPCARDLYCDGGACVPRKPNGEACVSPSECAGGGCVDGACANKTIATSGRCTGQ